MRRVIWSPRALADLDGIRGHVRERNPAAARRLIAALIEATERLAEFPELGKPGPLPGIRALVVPRTRFMIDYRHSGDRVEITAVTHGARRR